MVCKIIFHSKFSDIPDKAGRVTRGRTEAIAKHFAFHVYINDMQINRWLGLGWFLYDNGPRHERVKGSITFYLITHDTGKNKSACTFVRNKKQCINNFKTFVTIHRPNVRLKLALSLRSLIVTCPTSVYQINNK